MSIEERMEPVFKVREDLNNERRFLRGSRD